ncbi:hypothetical protein [Pseudoduganella sp. HUAS MS19]
MLLQVLECKLIFLAHAGHVRLVYKGMALEVLKDEAKKRGTTAQVYYERGNSERFNQLIEESKRILGAENVFILPVKKGK